MTEISSAEGAPQTWLDLLRDGRAAPSILLNVGVVLHGINIMIVSTIMPSVVVDIGGLSFYAWPSMIYMVGISQAPPAASPRTRRCTSGAPICWRRRSSASARC